MPSRTPAEVLARFHRDPVAWVRGMLGAEPDPWQADALRALAAGRNVAIRSGHGVGKTALASWAVLWWLSTRPMSIVPCTAPTQHQLSDLLWAEIDRWRMRSPWLRTYLVWTATRVSVFGFESAWFATARASNTPENLAGFHGRYLLYVVDEAAGIPDEMMAVADGALSTEGARMLMIGNPTRSTGYFAQRFGESQEAWYTRTISSEESSRVSRQWVRQMRDEWGQDSDVYRVRVLGLPPRGEAAGFIGTALVEAAMQRYDSTPADGPLEIGVDVARYGEDKSAVCARRGYKVIYLEARHGLSNPQVAAWVAQVAQDLAEDGERPIVRVDDDGVGGGVTDLLRLMAAEGSARVQPIPATFGGAGNRWYANNTGVYWGNLRRLMQDGLLALPRDHDLMEQLTSRTFAANARGKIVLERKEQMRARGVHSPDKADALALAFAPGQGSAWLTALKAMAAKEGGA